MRWREQDGVRWLEAELPGSRAAFTTRAGGTSRGGFASLNLGWLTGDEVERVRENRALVAGALELDPGSLAGALQVHGAAVIDHDAPDGAWLERPEDPERADGHATSTPGVAPYVLVADCLPVALAGSGGVAMLHCGWRGLAAGIIARGDRAGDRCLLL